MGLTPDVAAGGLIQSSWGNEIRNRTIQQFATEAERDTWASPPRGSVCITLDTLQLWVRRTSSWASIPTRARSTATTNAAGEILVNHGMGIAPSIVMATPGSSTVTLITDNFTTTNYRLRVYVSPGSPSTNSAHAWNWTAYP